jgi:hypothetical protein
MGIQRLHGAMGHFEALIFKNAGKPAAQYGLIAD